MNKKIPKAYEWINRLKRYEGNPIIRPHGKWAADLIFNPAAVVKDGQVWLLCRCVNLGEKRKPYSWSTSALVWAKSDDGLNFVLDDEPLLYPDEDSIYVGGFEDPRIVYIPEEKVYLLTYTGVSYKPDGKLYAPGMLAISKDLEHWDFYGEKFPGRAICIISEKINGKYWGYYGNSNKFITWSEDLINWHNDGEVLLKPRGGYFDEVLCEGACPPIISDEGILFIYNGATTIEATKKYAREVIENDAYTMFGMYSTGWALIDRNNPKNVIARSDKPFLAPFEEYECYGMVYHTIFSGGCIEFKGKHYLYYGACDNRICVEVEDI